MIRKTNLLSVGAGVRGWACPDGSVHTELPEKNPSHGS